MKLTDKDLIQLNKDIRSINNSLRNIEKLGFTNDIAYLEIEAKLIDLGIIAKRTKRSKYNLQITEVTTKNRQNAQAILKNITKGGASETQVAKAIKEIRNILKGFTKKSSLIKKFIDRINDKYKNNEKHKQGSNKSIEKILKGDSEFGATTYSVVESFLAFIYQFYKESFYKQLPSKQVMNIAETLVDNKVTVDELWDYYIKNVKNKKVQKEQRNLDGTTSTYSASVEWNYGRILMDIRKIANEKVNKKYYYEEV